MSKKNRNNNIVSEQDIQTEEVNMNTNTNTSTVPTINYEIDGHKIQFVGGPTNLWAVRVGNFKEAGPVLHYSDYGMVSAVLNAFTAMYHTKRYPVNEVGLHLKYSYADLKDLGSVEDAGYQKDADGNWHVVRWHAGQIIMGRLLTWVRGTKEEAEWVRQERKTINKMIAMDLLTMGRKIELRPVFQNDKDENDEGIKGTGANHVGMYLAAHAETLQATPEEAAKIIGQRIGKKVAYQTLGKNYGAVAAGRPPVITMTTIGVITDLETLEVERLPLEVLDGKRGYLFQGRFPLPGVRNLDDLAVKASIQQRGYNVLIQK